MLDGEPTFLFGFYHVSLSGPRRGQLLVDDINTLADAGFNLIHAFIGPDDPHVQEVLDTAAQREVYIIAQFWWGGDMIPSLEGYRDDPALIGWMVADDFGTPWDNPPSPKPIRNLTNVVHQYDPQGFAYGAGLGDPRYQNELYVDAMDAFGLEVYPVSSKNWPFETVLEESIMNYAHNRAVFAGKPLLALPQTFAWHGGRYPTPTETRNFVWGALIEGVNSILGYAYWDNSGLLPENNPAQWQELIRLGQDVLAFDDVLLYGNLTTYDSYGEIDYPIDYPNYPSGVGNARIHAGIWEYNGDVYVVVLNTSQSQSFEAEIPLPQGATGTPNPVFGGGRYGTGLTVQNGQLVGSVNPEEVHVYQIATSN